MIHGKAGCVWCISVSPLDDFSDLGFPVSDTLLLVSQLSHLVLQMPVGAAHFFKHVRQLGEKKKNSNKGNNLNINKEKTSFEFIHA